MRQLKYFALLAGFVFATALTVPAQAGTPSDTLVMAKGVAEVVHADPDFAVLRGGGAEWMLHADHTYRDHPLHGSLSEDLPRGIGAEIRLYGRDPDAAEAAARRLDFTVLQGAMDKPHGLRETFLIDADGYLWVPGVPLDGAS